MTAAAGSWMLRARKAIDQPSCVPSQRIGFPPFGPFAGITGSARKDKISSIRATAMGYRDHMIKMERPTIRSAIPTALVSADDEYTIAVRYRETVRRYSQQLVDGVCRLDGYRSVRRCDGYRSALPGWSYTAFRRGVVWVVSAVGHGGVVSSVPRVYTLESGKLSHIDSCIVGHSPGGGHRAGSLFAFYRVGLS